MRVGIIQSNYIPWRGYFDFIDDVDLFIFHDDIQYTKGDWRNRNRIKTAQGLRWLTVPVHYEHTHQKIQEIRIDYSKNWVSDHVAIFASNYSRAPFGSEARDLFESILAGRFEFLSELNVEMVRAVCRYLGIETRTMMSSELSAEGAKTQKLIGLLRAVGGTRYLSGPAGRNYIDENLFRAAGIGLDYKAYDYEPYPQIGGAFIGNVSILDLMANCGPDARKYMKSRARCESAMP